MRFNIVAAIAMAGFLPSCATVIRGTEQKYAITSTPPGANVDMTTGISCRTPCQLKMKRKTNFFATVSMPGFESQTFEVKSSASTGGGFGFAGNALLGGVIGAGVDLSNGSTKTLVPNRIDATLVRVASSAASLAPQTPAGPVAPLKDDYDSAGPAAAAANIVAASTTPAAGVAPEIIAAKPPAKLKQ
jgi:hypothetical protein